MVTNVRRGKKKNKNINIFIYLAACFHYGHMLDRTADFLLAITFLVHLQVVQDRLNGQ